MTPPDAPPALLNAARSGPRGQRRRIRGLRLRELLVLILLRHPTPMTVGALVAAVERHGFGIKGRAGKVVSDQLRYEVARGRVQRVDRGLYVAGTVTRQSRWRMQRRIVALRAGPPGDGWRGAITDATGCSGGSGATDEVDGVVAPG